MTISQSSVRIEGPQRYRVRARTTFSTVLSFHHPVCSIPHRRLMPQTERQQPTAWTSTCVTSARERARGSTYRVATQRFHNRASLPPSRRRPVATTARSCCTAEIVIAFAFDLCEERATHWARTETSMACDIDGPCVRRSGRCHRLRAKADLSVEARCAMLVAKILSGARPGGFQWSAHRSSSSSTRRPRRRSVWTVPELDCIERTR